MDIGKLPETKGMTEKERLVHARKAAQIVNKIYEKGGSLTVEQVRQICRNVIKETH